MPKPEFRESVKRSLLAAPEQARAEWSRIICRTLATSDLIPASGPGMVMLYAPILKIGEVDIAPLADALAQRGVGICLPRHDWTSRAMTPVRVSNLGADLVPDLVNQRLGLKLPRGDLPEVPIGELSAVIVPGLAFDHRGHRLGRGGGFYDRFLGRMSKDVRTIGVAFEVQVVAEVPVEGHDARLGALVTEARVEMFVP